MSIFTACSNRNDGYFLKRIGFTIVALLFIASAATAAAQIITPTPSCAVVPAPYPGTPANGYALYPAPPVTYPSTSGQYAVQYKVANGNWTDAKVYITRYGGSNSSPYLSFSGYTKTNTSMSFVSIPVSASELVQLRVTRVANGPFLASDKVSVRPSQKMIPATLAGDGTVSISRLTPSNFAGEQFILWWNRDATKSAALQGLVFFLNPPYEKPTGANVKTIVTASQLNGDLSAFDTLDFEGTITYSKPGSAEPAGAQAFVVPANIGTIYLAPGSWFQGKLAFTPTTPIGGQRRVYGPGVIDASRFEFDLRHCSDAVYGEQGYAALAALNPSGGHSLKNFVLDGIVIADNNFYATDSLTNSTVNNVKVLSWNENNDGLEFGASTTASNVFVRSGDDSLKLWGPSDTVTNATVWQNYNGGAVNLGWSNNSTGDYGLIDGLYVVKTDWFQPTNPTFIADQSNAVVHQNNAVIASMMVPGTQYGALSPPVFRNIFVEDPPQVLFSFKIIPPRANANTSTDILTTPSVLNLNIDNVFSPPSIVPNSIGFQTLPAGFTFFNQSFSSAYTLPGSMNINLTNVFATNPIGFPVLLTAQNTAVIGGIGINSAAGSSVNVTYGSTPVVAGTIQLVSTVNVTKQLDGSYLGTLTIANHGTGTAQNVALNSATLGAASASGLPDSIGNIGPGVSVTGTIAFPASAGASGAGVVERYSGTYTGGTFGSGFRVTLP